MMDTQALETRRRIVRLVEEYPGLHLREVARRLQTSVALVEYHVPILEQADLVVSRRDAGFVRLFPGASAGRPLAETDQARLSLLRARTPLHITLCLLDMGPTRHKDLARAVGLVKSNLSFHLRKLEAAGIVEKGADGLIGLVDRAAISRLLVEYAPTPEARDEFADLWLSLYGDDKP